MSETEHDVASPYFARKRRKNNHSEGGSAFPVMTTPAKVDADPIASTSESVSSMLPSEFYAKPCHDLARALLGKILLRKLPSGELLKGRIVETEGFSDNQDVLIDESSQSRLLIDGTAQAGGGALIIDLPYEELCVGNAYPGETDRASHSFKGKTARNAAMYAKAGTAYVYFIYGMYHNLNVSALEPGAGVLIRGLEPTEGLETMRTLRKGGAQLKVHQLCNGPGKICQAFGILTASHNFHDLTAGQELWLEDGPTDHVEVVEASRIGIAGYGQEWAQKLWRYYIRDSEHVSKRDKAQELKQFPVPVPIQEPTANAEKVSLKRKRH